MSHSTQIYMQYHSNYIICSHYKVFAVPVFKAENEPISAPYTPKSPLKHLLSGAVGTDAVSQTSDPMPFVIGSYKRSDFPTSLKFDGSWMKSAFKPKTHYSIAVAAFTKVCISFCVITIMYCRDLE